MAKRTFGVRLDPPDQSIWDKIKGITGLNHSVTVCKLMRAYYRGEIEVEGLPSIKAFKKTRKRASHEGSD